jgi:cation diffusion facilitator family transporter
LIWGRTTPTPQQRAQRGGHRKPFFIALALTAAYMIVEFVTGFLVNFLALISDAAHVGTDVLGLGMALAAITLASKKATTQRSDGFYRLEVLAARANGILLFGVAGYVHFEAVLRFSDPPTVPGLPLLVVAGLIVDLISFRLLLAGSKESLNSKGRISRFSLKCWDRSASSSPRSFSTRPVERMQIRSSACRLVDRRRRHPHGVRLNIQQVEPD